MGVMGPKVCIVGGTGRMGSWLGVLLESHRFQVFKVGKKTELKAADVVPVCDLVVVSVPIADSVKVITEVGPLVKEDALFMDLTSVKSETMRAMLSSSSAREVVGVHPLFGPDKPLETSSRVVLCPGRGERGIGRIGRFLTKIGFAVSILDPQAHDRIMGLIQGVNHFSTLALALCMAGSGFSLEDMTTVATTSFKRRIERVHVMLDQSVDLFQSLLMENSEAQRFAKKYQDQAAALLDTVTKGDSVGFERIWETLTAFFGHQGKES